MRVGVLGGAFNPPHIGHLLLAQEALLQLNLDRVSFVPMGQAPHRVIDDDPGGEARLEMCELATRDDERFSVSRIELDRRGPSYTSDTLRELGEHAPGDELVLLLDGDQAAALPAWHEPEQVLARAEVAVAERTGFEREAVAAKVGGLAGADDIRFFDMPRVDVSSSLVRRRAAGGVSVRYFVPEPVEAYISRNGLYAASAAVGAE